MLDKDHVKKPLWLSKNIHAIERRWLNRNQLGICGGRADEEISSKLYELILAPTPGIIFCNLHTGGKDHCEGVSMSRASPEVQDIKIHSWRLKLEFQSGKDTLQQQ
jgi:hypothetical protein